MGEIEDVYGYEGSVDAGRDIDSDEGLRREKAMAAIPIRIRARLAIRIQRI